MDLEDFRSDDVRYTKMQELKQRKWEALCRYCGACCGIFEDDPCEHLIEGKDGKYFCDIYETRFGMRKTKKGRSFQCVPIRDVLHKSWAGDQNCSYKK